MTGLPKAHGSRGNIYKFLPQGWMECSELQSESTFLGDEGRLSPVIRGLKGKGNLSMEGLLQVCSGNAGCSAGLDSSLRSSGPHSQPPPSPLPRPTQRGQGPTPGNCGDRTLPTKRLSRCLGTAQVLALWGGRRKRRWSVAGGEEAEDRRGCGPGARVPGRGPGVTGHPEWEWPVPGMEVGTVKGSPGCQQS